MYDPKYGEVNENGRVFRLMLQPDTIADAGIEYGKVRSKADICYSGCALDPLDPWRHCPVCARVPGMFSRPGSLKVVHAVNNCDSVTRLCFNCLSAPPCVACHLQGAQRTIWQSQLMATRRRADSRTLGRRPQVSSQPPTATWVK